MELSKNDPHSRLLEALLAHRRIVERQDEARKRLADLTKSEKPLWEAVQRELAICEAMRDDPAPEDS